jgi:hypothetical protein
MKQTEDHPATGTQQDYHCHQDPEEKACYHLQRKWITFLNG